MTYRWDHENRKCDNCGLIGHVRNSCPLAGWTLAPQFSGVKQHRPNPVPTSTLRVPNAVSRPPVAPGTIPHPPVAPGSALHSPMAIAPSLHSTVACESVNAPSTNAQKDRDKPTLCLINHPRPPHTVLESLSLEEKAAIVSVSWPDFATSPNPVHLGHVATYACESAKEDVEVLLYGAGLDPAIGQSNIADILLQEFQVCKDAGELPMPADEPYSRFLTTVHAKLAMAITVAKNNVQTQSNSQASMPPSNATGKDKDKDTTSNDGWKEQNKTKTNSRNKNKKPGRPTSMNKRTVRQPNLYQK